MLAHGDPIAGIEALGQVGERLQHQRTCGAELRLGLCVAELERGAVGLRSRAAGLALHQAGELVEQSSADTHRPATVAGDSEADDPEAVEAAAALGHRGDREVAPAIGHEHVLHRVVDAARAAQAHHVPVVDQVDLFDRRDEDPRLAGLLDDAQRVNVRRVLQSGAEAPRPAQRQAAIDHRRRARPRALAGDHRVPSVAPQFGYGVVRQVRTGSADRQVGCHRHPAGGGIGVRQVLEHLQRVHGIELRAAQLLRNPDLQQSIAVQRLDGRRRELAFGVSELCLGIEQRNERLGLLGEDGTFGECVAERHAADPFVAVASSQRAYAGTPLLAASSLAVVSLLRPTMNRIR